MMWFRAVALTPVLLISMLAAGCATPSQQIPTQATTATVVQPTIAAQPTAVPLTATPQPTTAQPTPVETGDVALKISGRVDREMAWTEQQVRAMPLMKVKGTNSQGASEDYTGVSLNDLLKQAGVQPGATTLVFNTAGGQNSEAALGEVQTCTQCILSFRTRGGFSLRMPGFPAAVQLKGVTSITVK